MSLLTVRGVSKRYGAVVALRSGNLTVEPGEIHALMGANGAGKSTLVKMLTGVIRPDTGTIAVRDQLVRITSPAAARRVGLAAVFQDPALVPDLTALQNLRLTGTDVASVRHWLGVMDLAHIDLGELAGDLPLPSLRMIDLARALAHDPHLLLLDEITAALPSDLAERVFLVMRRWRESGRSVLFISHRLAEVRAVCDRATVLRDGADVGTLDVSDSAEERIVALMLGPEAASSHLPSLSSQGAAPHSIGKPTPRGAASGGVGGAAPQEAASVPPFAVRGEGRAPTLGARPGPETPRSGERPGSNGGEGEGRVCEKSTGTAGSAGVSPVPASAARAPGTGETPALPGLFTDPEGEAHPLLDVRELRAGGVVESVSFAVRPGEVLGVAALEGQGQDILFDVLAGRRRADGGAITVAGRPLHARTPYDAIRAGVVLVPADRLQGLLPRRPVYENIATPLYNRVARWGPIDGRSEGRRVRDAIARLSIDTRSQRQARRLSGGNQQKVTIARWLASGFRVMLLFDPTRGIDVGTKRQIYALLRELAAGGAAILLFTSELPEIQLVCDRVVVLYEGRVVRELPAAEADEGTLLRAAHGLTHEEAAVV
jgi:ABC-type sugar transport system ATPase subunit